MRRDIKRLAVLAGLVAPMAAEARPEYPTWVPTPYDCETCHLDPNDRLNRTGFGIDFALQRGVWVDPNRPGRGLCFLDSDYDGITNGVELADPACVWQRGDPRPAGPTTHPGDGRDPDQCGDGVIIPFAEECDGAAQETTCVELGFAGGALGCYADCTLDTRGCERAPPPDMAPPDMAPVDMAPPDMAPVDMQIPDMAPGDMAADMAASDMTPGDMAPPLDGGSLDMAADLDPTDAGMPSADMASDQTDTDPAPALDMAPAGADPTAYDPGCFAAPGGPGPAAPPALLIAGLLLALRRRLGAR